MVEVKASAIKLAVPQQDTFLRTLWKDAFANALRSGQTATSAAMAADVGVLHAIRRFGSDDMSPLRGMALDVVIMQLGFQPGTKIALIVPGDAPKAGTVVELCSAHSREPDMKVKVEWDTPWDGDTVNGNDDWVPAKNCILLQLPT